jgi:hypothetical protein
LTFTFSGDSSTSRPITMETTMTETNFSGKYLGLLCSRLSFPSAVSTRVLHYAC